VDNTSHRRSLDPLLSVVIPAYNEGERLPSYLESIQLYFDKISLFDYEIIVVDDGSNDSSASIVRHMAATWAQLRLVQHPGNRGKGEALRTGIVAAGGSLILLADADGATPVEAERGLREAIRAGADLAVGSRLVGRPEVRCQRIWYRSAAGRLFARIARSSLRLPVRDTQCGFKMVRRDLALELAVLCREPGYLLDVEMLAFAQAMGRRIDEVPVPWSDVPGSKLRMVRDGGRMLQGLWRVRRAVRLYTRGERGAGRARVASQVS
jgi:dolichyl-phosphate beta-glucosyltransferase